MPRPVVGDAGTIEDTYQPNGLERILKPIPDVIRWYAGHKVAGTLLLAAFLVSKGWVASKGDLPTALAILDTTGIATVVTGALLTSLSLFVAILLSISVVRMILEFPRHQRDLNKRRHLVRLPLAYRSLWLTMGTILIACLSVPTMLLLGSLVSGGLLGFLVSSRRHFRDGSRLVRRRLIRWWIAIAWLTGAMLVPVCTYATFDLLYSIWLPHEVISFLSPNRPSEVGYVLDDSNGWMTILRSGEHRILRVRDESVSQRKLCEAGPPRLYFVDLSSTPWKQLTDLSRALKDLRPPTASHCPKPLSGDPYPN